MGFVEGKAKKYWYNISPFNNLTANRTPPTSLLLLN